MLDGLLPLKACLPCMWVETGAHMVQWQRPVYREKQDRHTADLQQLSCLCSVVYIPSPAIFGPANHHCSCLEHCTGREGGANGVAR